MDSTERLCMIADIIELQPELHEQEIWTHESGYVGDVDHDPACGTPACVAGWAVRLTPVEEIKTGNWVLQGAASLGLDNNLACAMFAASWKPEASVSEVLRIIAKIPEGERSLTRARAELWDHGIDGRLW